MAATNPSQTTAAPTPEQAAAAAAFQQFTVEAFVLLAVGICVTVIRTAARIKIVGIKGLQWDDLLVWLGTTFYAVETALAYSVGHAAQGLANNGMTDEQRAALSPDSPEYQTRITGCKIQIAGWTTYSTLLWCLKASLLVFYRRLTAGVGDSYRIRVNIGFGFLAASFIVVTANLYLGCRPFHKNWQIYPDPGNVCQPAVSNQVVWVYLTFNVATDLYLISIPLPMLWQSSLKPLKKAALLLVFSGGIMVVACAILRCVMIITDPVNGAQLAGSWAVRETFIAMVVANLPMIFPVCKIWLGPLIASIRSTVRSSQKLSDNEPSVQLRTFGAGSSSRGRRGPPTVYNITNATVTFNESEERMVQLQENKGWTEATVGTGQVATDATGDKRDTIQQDIEVSVVRENSNSHDKRPPPLW